MLRCVLCKRGFIIKRMISTLFKKDNYIICDDCYKKNPLDICLSTIPLNNRKMLNIISMFSSDIITNYKAFIFEYSFIVLKYLNLEPIIIDRIFLNNDFINSMNDLSLLLDKDLYVITYKIENSS